MLTIKIRISALLLLATVPCFGQKAPPAPGESQTDLAQQAADPTAPLMAFNFKLEYVPTFFGLSGSGTGFLFQRVIPLRAWKQNNLLRVTVNYDITGPEQQGLDDTSLGGEKASDGNDGQQGLANVAIFDLIVFNKPWGRWGVGPLVQFVPNTKGNQDSAMLVPPSASSPKKEFGTWDCSTRTSSDLARDFRASSRSSLMAWARAGPSPAGMLSGASTGPSLSL